MTTAQDDGPRSLVAQERVVETTRAGLFALLLGGLSLAVVVLLVVVGTDLPTEPIAAESALLESDGVTALLYEAMDVRAARLATALAAGLAVAAAGAATRQLLHSDGAGLLAAFLVAADPAFLARGQLALPTVPAVALAMGAFAFALVDRHAARWGAGILLATATLLQPTLLLWSAPLAALVLLRGNIYAAPKHLGLALLQIGLLPLLAFIGALASGHDLAGCLDPARWAALRLAVAHDLGAGRIAFHSPAVWLAGWAALLLLGIEALATAGRHFRMARLPGRLQLRLVEPLRPSQGRILWLLLLAATAPLPSLWLPLAAAALAAGIKELSGDAPAFGGAVAAGTALFALLYLVRLWGVVDGSASPEEAARLLDIVPWARIQGC
ncbi:MAG: hypothetical protein ACPGQL_10995 [Thermoplasmatota archaeon]